MIGTEKSTILPFALWTENPPIHNISCILHLEKSNLIVTGCESGHLIIWSTQIVDNQLVPVNYMIGHRSKLISIALAGSRKLTDVDYFVSFSKDGEICLWDAGRGRSIEFVSNAAFDVQSVFSYESENAKQRLLLCCLKSPEIAILNSMSLSEVCTVVSLNSLHTFSSVTCFNISTKDDVVFGTTVSGVTLMWVLNFNDINTKAPFNPKVNTDKFLKIDLTDPIAIAHNPRYRSIILIISAAKFLVYHAKNWSILCCMSACRGDYFIGGEFISSQFILIHCESGKSLFYKLPPRSDYGDPLFGQTSTNLCDNIPKLICQFKVPKDFAICRHKVTTKIIEHGFVIWKGFSNGNICKWEFKRSAVEIEPQLYSLSNAWKHMVKDPTSLAGTFDGPESSGPVTSLLYLPDLTLFILGMHNGSIFITNLENSLSGVFKKTPQSQTSYIKLTGHCGPVLCLMHPCSTMKLPGRLTSCSNPKLKVYLELFKQARYLWSGGEDFSIRIWDIKSQQCITAIHCHSAPVVLLRLNHLSYNDTNTCGFNNELTSAMLRSVHEDDPNKEEIRQMINTCMNAFMVVISEDDGISIITLIKRKLLIHSVEHDSPVKSLGWFLDSGFLLLETVNETVYVWDLNSKSMDRFETADTAGNLMLTCPLITKIRSQSSGQIVRGSDMIGRHSLSNLSANRNRDGSVKNKFIKFQFIKSDQSDRYVPVVIFDLTILLDALNNPSRLPTQFYSLFSEIDNTMMGFGSSDSTPSFDKLMMDGTVVNRDMDLKMLIIKIILSLAHYDHTLSPLNSLIFKFLDMKSDTISCSFGRVNSKTGCITFNTKNLFLDASESSLTINKILLQLSISNRIANPSNRSRLDSSVTTLSNIDVENNSLFSWTHSSSDLSYNFSQYSSSTKFTKLLLAYKKSIIDDNIPMLLRKTEKKKKFSDPPHNLSFYTMEHIFHSLILGIMDVSDWISMSSYQILVKVIADLSIQEIQNYLLIIRKILLPDLDHYTSEGGRKFADRIQPYLYKICEQSFLASDWNWWYSPICIKIDQDKRKLTKIQIKALVYLALIGTYLNPEDNRDDVKLFSKVFSLDNFFLARITCDFLLDLLNIDASTVKLTKNRLVSLAVLCLSNGFAVWEPHLNSTILIGKLFELAEDNDTDDEEDCFVLSSLAKQALRTIAMTKPLTFIMKCYLTLQNCAMTGPLVPHISTKKLHRMQSSPAMINYDTEAIKGISSPLVFKKNILFSILDELCETKSEIIGDLLPEIVEIYLIYHAKFGQMDLGVQHVMHPVLKFPSVGINNTSGQVSVGASSGLLVLFDYKIGRYFTQHAHLKPVSFTQFSHDSKHLASYSIDDGTVKIWQISHNGLFHVGSGSYHVRLMSSHRVPSIDDMIMTADSNSVLDVTDQDKKDKKKKGLKKSLSKNDKPIPYSISKESGLGLSWNSDNKTVSICLNGTDLRKFRL